MNVDRLTIQPAADADHLAAVDFIWQGGPIAGRLWFDEYVPALEELGEPETAATLVANGQESVGWLLWCLDEEVATGADEPWEPRVYLLGPTLSMPDAMGRALVLLEDFDLPRHSYDRSLAEVNAMHETETVYFDLMPQRLSVAARDWRKRRWASRATARR